MTEKNQAANDKQFHRVSMQHEAVRLRKLRRTFEDIADKMGIAESSVRNLVDSVYGARRNQSKYF